MMERSDRRRLRESGIPLDFSGPMRFFAAGMGLDDGVLQVLPPEDWPREIAAMAAEESEFWKGSSVSIQLIVELPFWLTIPDCEISVSHDRATVRACIRGQYMAVSDGPLFYNSHRNVVFVGPNEDLKVGKEQPPVVTATQAAIYRPMKTVVLFRAEAIEDAIVALQERQFVTQEELPKVRRINRAAQYLESLAYAHIPFLNRLITSYRFTSRDPFAFRVSAWDVPVWFAEYNGELVRICLMPYSDGDWYPTLSTFEQREKSAFYAASPDAVKAQARADIAPGMLEILDAQTLLYRGHLDDAVRSAVTAIEVALESQITNLLTRNGCTEQQVKTRLEQTWNDFDARLADYERISGTRVPGPILSCIPYINGVRLKFELSQVRRLRHKIVHEGLRVDSQSRGPMLRAIETMAWLFHWLSWEEGKAQDKSGSYVFFEMMRGAHIPRYRIAYRDSGVVVLPRKHCDEQVKNADELIRAQYSAAIDGEQSDIDLFALMSFAYLGIDAEDAPPPLDNVVVHERYHIDHNEHHAIVFCLECDGFVDAGTIVAITSRLLGREPHHEGSRSGLCIINHQKHTAIGLREVEKAIPGDVNRIANEGRIALITATDLLLLVHAAGEYKWEVDQISKLFFVPGRQGLIPPAYHRIGTYVRFYPRPSVISVDLHPGETVKVRDTLGIRLATRYHEESIESLQVEHNALPAATGPCRVGIKTTLRKSDLHTGQAVFLA